MDNTITTNILNSYGYKESEPQYKTVNYQIIPKYQNLEDHIEKPQSEFLQQLIDAKKTRELVEIHGITLEKTKQFYAEKIKEYNDIIDLKHIKSKRNSSENQKHQQNAGLIRFAGDKGKITNFHISINSGNLNPLLNELKKQENQEYQTTICKTPLIIPKISIHQHKQDYMYKIDTTNYTKKTTTVLDQSYTQRLEQKLSQIDSQIYQNKNDTEQIILNNMEQLKKRKSITIDTKFKRRNSGKKRTNPPQYQRLSELPRIDISQVITDSFRQQNISAYQNTEISLDKVELQQNSNNLQITQINFPIQIKEPNDILENENENHQENSQNISQFDEQYQSIQMNYIENLDGKKKQLQRRKEVVNEILNKKKPQFLHICGSKFPVINNDQNWNDYKTLKLRILEKQLEKELENLKNQKEKAENYDNLKVLEGPPIKIDFKTSDIKSDYQDIKITKILKKIIAVK